MQATNPTWRLPDSLELDSLETDGSHDWILEWTERSPVVDLGGLYRLLLLCCLMDERPKKHQRKLQHQGLMIVHSRPAGFLSLSRGRKRERRPPGAPVACSDKPVLHGDDDLDVRYPMVGRRVLISPPAPDMSLFRVNASTRMWSRRF